MNPNQTPAPQEIKVALDEVTLIVPDISKPVWFGTYYSGKLAIYEAQVEIHPDASEAVLSYIDNCIIYLCTLTETGTEDFMIYSPYEKDIPATDICNHLLDNVWTAYQGQLEKNNKAAYVHGTNTLQ